MINTELFQEEKIRKILHNGEWFFSVVDVINILMKNNVKDKGA